MVLLNIMADLDNIELLEIIKKLVVKDKDNYEVDVLVMKNLVKSMPGISELDNVKKERYDKLFEIEKLLIKYKEKNFYLVYPDNDIFKNDSYTLYTQEEVNELLPKNIDINKISYSGGHMPNIIKSFGEYKKVNGNVYYYTSLSFRHENFKMVDDQMSKMALWFAHFSS